LTNRLLIQLGAAQIVAIAAAWLILNVLDSMGMVGADVYSLSDHYAYYRVHRLVIQSIERATDDTLRLSPNEQLRAQMAAMPDLKIAAFEKLTDGPLEGSSSEIAAAVAQIASLEPTNMEFRLASDAAGKRQGVSIWRERTPFGPLHIAVAIGSGASFAWSDLLWSLHYYSPQLTTILAVVFLVSAAVTCFAVRRSVAPLRRTAEAAERLEIGSLGQGLVADGAPTEIIPLVEAINKALARLDASAERMRRYTANAAHELRTPVAILRARVENAAESALKTEMRRDVKKVQAIIDQLLISARLTENQAAVADEVDLVRAARQATADYSPLVFVCGRRIAFEAEAAQIPVCANAQAVDCVIANLIDNALRAEPEGGTVLVRVRRDAVVEVVDHGAGVAPQDRELIFEPFWRKSDDGAGLGLAISRELIEKLGGRIGVRETPQGGATFELQFQRSEASGEDEGVRA
jgi:signal transduction histidine kinase